MVGTIDIKIPGKKLVGCPKCKSIISYDKKDILIADYCGQSTGPFIGGESYIRCPLCKKIIIVNDYYREIDR